MGNTLGKGDEHGTYLGPTISHGSQNFWTALGIMKNISKVDYTNYEFQLKLIMGLHL